MDNLDTKTQSFDSNDSANSYIMESNIENYLEKLGIEFMTDPELKS